MISPNLEFAADHDSLEMWENPQVWLGSSLPTAAPSTAT